MLTQTINYSTLEDQLPASEGYSGLHRGRRNSWDSPVKPRTSLYRTRRSSICDTAGTTRLRSVIGGCSRDDDCMVPLSMGLSPVSRYGRMHGSYLNKIQGYSAKTVSCFLIGSLLLMALSAVFILMRGVPSGVTSGKFRGIQQEQMDMGNRIEAEPRSSVITDSTIVVSSPAKQSSTTSTRSKRAQKMIERHDANKVANNKIEQESVSDERDENKDQQHQVSSPHNEPKMVDSKNIVGSFDLGAQNSEKNSKASPQTSDSIDAVNVPVPPVSPNVVIPQSGTENVATHGDQAPQGEIHNQDDLGIPLKQFHVPDPVNSPQPHPNHNQEQDYLINSLAPQHALQQQGQLLEPTSPNRNPLPRLQPGNLINQSSDQLPNTVQGDTVKLFDNLPLAQPQILTTVHIQNGPYDPTQNQPQMHDQNKLLIPEQNNNGAQTSTPSQLQMQNHYQPSIPTLNQQPLSPTMIQSEHPMQDRFEKQTQSEYQPQVGSEGEDRNKDSLPIPSVPTQLSDSAFPPSSSVLQPTEFGVAPASAASSDPALNSLPDQSLQGEAVLVTSQESLSAPTETDHTQQEHLPVEGNELHSNESVSSENDGAEDLDASYTDHHPKNLHRLLKQSPKSTDANIVMNNTDAPDSISASVSVPKITDSHEIKSPSTDSVSPNQMLEALSSSGAYSKIIPGLSESNQIVEHSTEVPTQSERSGENVDISDSQISELHSSDSGSANDTLSDTNQETQENYFHPKNVKGFSNRHESNKTPKHGETFNSELPADQVLPPTVEEPRNDENLVDSKIETTLFGSNDSNATEELKESVLLTAQQNQMPSQEHQNAFPQKHVAIPAPQSLERNAPIQSSGSHQQLNREQHEQQPIHDFNLQHQTITPNSFSSDQPMYKLQNVPTKEQSTFLSEVDPKPQMIVHPASQAPQAYLPVSFEPTLQQTDLRTLNSPSNNENWSQQQTLQTNLQTRAEYTPELVQMPSNYQQEQWQQQQLLLKEHMLRQTNFHHQQPHQQQQQPHHHQQQQPNQQQQQQPNQQQQQQPNQQQQQQPNQQQLHQQQSQQQQQTQPQAPQPTQSWQMHQYPPENPSVIQQQAWPLKGVSSSQPPTQQQQDWPPKQIDSYQQIDWSPKRSDSYQQQDMFQHQMDPYNLNSPHYPQGYYNYPGSAPPFSGMIAGSQGSGMTPPYQNAPPMNDPILYPGHHRPSNVLPPHEPRWPYKTDGNSNHEVPVMENPVLNPSEKYPPGVNPNLYRLY